MKEQYFTDLTSHEAIKARYKELAKQYHPDCGGSVEIMKEVNGQYEKVLEGFYQKSGKSITEIEDLLRDDLEVRNKLCEILGYPNLIVELCGVWIWVTGETRIARQSLKSAGFSWASKKLAWYWHKKEEVARFYRGKCSMDEIRSKHGSTTISSIKNSYKIV